MNIMNKFTDLTSLGSPPQGYGLNLLSDDKLYNNYTNRVEFYKKFIDSLLSSNPKAAEDLFRIVNLNKHNNDKLEEQLEFIKYYFQKKDTKKDEIVKEINSKLKGSLMGNDYEAKPVTKGGTNDDPPNVPPENVKKYFQGVTGEKYEDIEKDKNIKKYKPFFNTEKDGTVTVTDDGDEYFKDNTDTVLRTYENSLDYGPNVEKVKVSDRLIFVIATYIIRSISIFITEWGIHTGMINSFSKGFGMYFLIYTCVFLLLVVLTNASEQDKVFRMMFFYINTQSESGLGVMRIIAHVACIALLIPIPFIVREYREEKGEILTFTEKRAIVNAVSKFTTFAWILTSIVAMRL